MNSRGPRTEPWGTPHKQAHEEERWLSHLTRKLRDDKYDLNQFKRDPWIPNQEVYSCLSAQFQTAVLALRCDELLVTLKPTL